MGAGNDTANLFAGQALNGTLNGGAGSDTLTLNGPGTASFAGASAFETLGVLGGNWTLTGAQSYATATSVASGASLAVNGSLSTGTLTFASGSTYNVAVTPAAAAGAVTATGAVTLAGGSVAVTAASGAYANVTQYTLISGASLTGTFTGGATVNLPFLVPSLVYSNTAVQLVLTRNLTFLTQKAVTPNQIAGGDGAGPQPDQQRAVRRPRAAERCRGRCRLRRPVGRNPCRRGERAARRHRQRAGRRARPLGAGSGRGAGARSGSMAWAAGATSTAPAARPGCMRRTPASSPAMTAPLPTACGWARRWAIPTPPSRFRRWTAAAMPTDWTSRSMPKATSPTMCGCAAAPASRTISPSRPSAWSRCRASRRWMRATMATRSTASPRPAIAWRSTR